MTTERSFHRRSDPAEQRPHLRCGLVLERPAVLLPVGARPIELRQLVLHRLGGELELAAEILRRRILLKEVAADRRDQRQALRIIGVPVHQHQELRFLLPERILLRARHRPPVLLERSRQEQHLQPDPIRAELRLPRLIEQIAPRIVELLLVARIERVEPPPELARELLQLSLLSAAIAAFTRAIAPLASRFEREATVLSTA